MSLSLPSTTSLVGSSCYSLNNHLSSDRILAMIKQEREVYNNNSFTNNQISSSMMKPTIVSRSSNTNTITCGAVRTMMLQWCIYVVKFCNKKLPIQCVEYAMNYSDRYCTLLSKTTKIDAIQYQLIVMTSFYIAVKIHSQIVINIKIIHELSKKIFSIQQIVDMELNILKTLQWKMNPPLAIEFAYQFLNTRGILINGIPKQKKLLIFNDTVKCILQIIRVKANVRSSQVALHALFTTLQGIDQNIANKFYQRMYNTICCIDNVKGIQLQNNNNNIIPQTKSLLLSKKRTRCSYIITENSKVTIQHQQPPTKRSRIEFSPRSTLV